MRGRHLAIGAAALATGIATAVVPAIGADHAVTARSDNTYAPATLTVTTGDSVTFRNGGGAHNVHFEDEIDAAFGPTQTAWEHKRTFTRAGAYRFFCDAHGDRGGNGMHGVVTVVDPPETVPAPKPAPAIEHFAAVPLRGRFCVREDSRCKRPGVVIRMQLPADVRVTGTLQRRAISRRKAKLRHYGTVAFDLRKGRRSVRFTRTRQGLVLLPGHYRLVLRAGEERDIVRFNVRGS